jgi:AraC-like DNA-binding protein
MILEKIEIRYKGKVVFERLVMSPKITRMPKFFEEDEACFLFVTKGSFYFRTPTHILSFGEGDAMLTKCGKYFIENPSSHAEQMDGAVVAVVGAFFYPAIVKDFFQTDLSIKEFRQQKDTTKISIEPLLKAFVEGLNFMLDNPILVDDNLVATKLKELLILLSKSERANSVSEFVQSLFVPQEYNFKEIIKQNQLSNLSLNELAYLCGMSLATFKRKFAEIYRQSPSKYLLIKKLEKAERLMTLKVKPISEVAYESGFESVPHFNKAFKRHYQQTPSEYRRSRMDKPLS